MNPKIQTDDAILIFGDLQDGVVKIAQTVSEKEIRRSAHGLAVLGEIFDWPTFAVSIPETGIGHRAMISEITQCRTCYREILRTTPDSFENVEFCTAIEETGRKTLIVCGVATEIVVHWLVLSGIARGYKVYVVVDACGGRSVRSEEAAFRRFDAAGAIMTSLFSLAGEVAGDFTKPMGRRVVDEVIYKVIGAQPQ